MKESAESVREHFRALALVEFDPNEFLSAEAQSDNVRCLLAAADLADDIFWRQVLPDGDRFSLLAQAGDDEELKEILLLHYGPYDRLNDDAPFLPAEPKVPGAGFYPPDLTREEFSSYVRTHPESAQSLESPYSVVRRTKTGLVAVPYHEAYHEQVERLSRLLVEASASEHHPAFRQFLEQRAQALRTDDYYHSDSLWVHLSDNPVDLVIGPYEVYEDQLMGFKASYEAMVLGRQLEETAKIRHFQRELSLLCRLLEPQLGQSLVVQDNRVDLSVANLVHAAGDARKTIPAIAFMLPNDDRVIEEIGSRQVILRNVLEAKFRLVAWPMLNRLLQTPMDDQVAAFNDFFNHTLFHEIAHSIGPHRITKNGESTTVNRALKQYYTVLEEAKADSLGACLMFNVSDDSASRAFLDNYVVGFLRGTRFGLSEAHGGASAIQFNYLLRDDAIAVDRHEGKLSVDYHRALRSVVKLASDILSIQERGDFEAAMRFVSEFCVMNPEIEGLLRAVSGSPVDIRIRYKAYTQTPAPAQN